MKRHPLLLAYLALGSVCFFWGTTYPAIRMSLEAFPPVLLVGCRFTVSGLLLLGGARLAGVRMPDGKDILYSSAFGVLALGVGNTCLTYAEIWIPSGLASLFVTTSPFWMVGLEAAWTGGERLQPVVLAGMLVGLAGTAVLVGPEGFEQGMESGTTRGFLLLQFGCLSWSFASIAQRRRIRHVNAVVNGGIQQLAAGATFLVVALALGQNSVNFDSRGVYSMLYLVAFGSVVGYTSYIYVLKKLPIAVVTIHVYINPVVATTLGWLLFREPFGTRQAMAMAVIFLGVAIVKRFSGPGPAK
ncbi:MAG: EamA family transporter [bacterium]|nr:EamA family transporter [bacterium]